VRVSAAKAIRDGMLVDVCRKVEGVDSIDGFILASSKNWLLVKDANVLRTDGFWIFRRDKVISLKRSKTQAYKEQMMNRSGLLVRLCAHSHNSSFVH
jgi:hypothetical protein